MAPIVLYLGQFEPAEWIYVDFIRGHNLFFGFLAFCTVMTLKLTRRKIGFKPSPTDFLVVVIAVLVPQLVPSEGQRLAVMVLTVKAIVLFFGCDVLLGELRGKNAKFAAMVLAGLGVLVV
jgi:UDP-GlcNAc:undecaprenyl-phosphate GlcNAc-1-phosphate transferase